MTRWTFNRTYVGDPDSHKPSEVVGYRDHHVQLAEFIDSHGNTKVEVVEEHSSPNLVSNWQLMETYYGDPETGTHHEVVGWKPYHRELAKYICPSGKTKTEVVNEDEHDQSWEAEKEEYEKQQREKRREREQQSLTCSAPDADTVEDSPSLEKVKSLTYTRKDRTTETVNLLRESEE